MSVRNGQHFEKQDCVRFRAIELLYSASRGPLTGVTRLSPSPTLSLIASEIKKKVAWESFTGHIYFRVKK